MKIGFIFKNFSQFNLAHEIKYGNYGKIKFLKQNREQEEISSKIITTIDDINKNNLFKEIFHISLEEFFVVTVIPGKTKYTLYLTAYQMYHEVYGYDIQKIKTKKEFIEIINKFPYKNWFISIDVDIMNWWINTIVTYNNNVPRIGIQIFYIKSVGTYNFNDIKYKKALKLPSEYIYNNQNLNYQSKLHFKRFYRITDIINLSIHMYNNNIGVFIRKLYVYANELLITTWSSLSSYSSSPSDLNLLFGFQYIEYEKIYCSTKNLMPELVLTVPFDRITKSESVERQYSIQYYKYDMTKIYNNRNIKNLLINPCYIDDSLYDYYSRIYRLKILSEKNKLKFTNRYSK